MTEAIERLVNLALFFANARGAVTAEQARTQVGGYSADQDHDAFIRMFERDKDELRRAGLVITADDAGNYTLDRSATYSAHLDLDAGERAAIRVVTSGLADDPAFPYREELRLALAKISPRPDEPRVPASTRLADEDPQGQGASAATLIEASKRSKRVTFDYTNSAGRTAPHEVEPFGLFLHDGRWYLVGRDTALDEVRTYTVGRIGGLAVNPASPKSPDFERPLDFDIARFVRLPFQYGPDAARIDAVLEFAPNQVWRADALTAGQGRLEPVGDALRWTVEVRSTRALLRYVLEHGPGIRVIGPPQLAEKLRAGLTAVEVLHG